MSSPNAIVIIGGSRGIGLELVQQASVNFPNAVIYATARDPAKATELQTLAGIRKNVKIIAADAKDGHSMELAAKAVSDISASIDQVIYNAGVLSGWGSLLDAGIDGFKNNIDTNVYGAYYAAQHFTPLLLKSQYEKKSLAFISTNFASFALADETYKSHAAAFGSAGHDPSALYNISKTALNRLGKELDTVFRPQGLPIRLIHPGLVKTRMNPMGNIETPESAAGILEVVNSGSGPLFVDWQGKEVPW